MRLFFNGNRINQIYHGGQMIKQVYNGSQLVWSAIKEGEVIFESGNVGDSTLSISVSGVYEIIAVGGGGGTVTAVGGSTSTVARSCTGAAGGSGALGIGQFRLNAGQQLNITVGSHGGDKTDFCFGGGSGTNYITCDNGGDSKVLLSGDALVVAGGGGGGYTDNRQNNNTYASPRAGSGGTATIHSSAVSSSAMNGNNGTASHAGWDYSISVTGGASVYNGYGKASSGSAWCPQGVNIDNTGTAGYVCIKFIGY